ncbi:MAG: aconitase/3-isopropylmalate dehydratase large subunit family protein [Trueperaceae bacterium]
MHTLHKTLARAAGVSEVEVGDIIEVTPDFVYFHDTGGPKVMQKFKEMGFDRIVYPDRVACVFDHEVPPNKVSAANQHKELQAFCIDQGVRYYYAKGICHQLIPELGLAGPGMLVMANDSHTTMLGAVGAFATGIGYTEAAATLGTGKNWCKVPPIVRLEIRGRLTDGVMAKDVMLHILQEKGMRWGLYKALEFAGPTVRDLDMDGRMALTNMSIEIAGKAGFIEPDAKTEDFFGSEVYERFASTGAGEPVYDEVAEFNVEGLAPQVACPHTVDNVRPASELEDVPIHQAFIGSCTGGRFEDLEIAARIFKNNRAHPRVKTIVIPNSLNQYRMMVDSGLLDVFLDAGCTVTHSTCGPCTHHHLGLLAGGETCIASSPRNHKGRMGDKDSLVYISSAATVAASAVTGHITDPRPYLKDAVRVPRPAKRAMVSMESA